MVGRELIVVVFEEERLAIACSVRPMPTAKALLPLRGLVDARSKVVGRIGFVVDEGVSVLLW
jgi:hypothetical protein